MPARNPPLLIARQMGRKSKNPIYFRLVPGDGGSIWLQAIRRRRTATDEVTAPTDVHNMLQIVPGQPGSPFRVVISRGRLPSSYFENQIPVDANGFLVITNS